MSPEKRRSSVALLSRAELQPLLAPYVTDGRPGADDPHIALALADSPLGLLLLGATSQGIAMCEFFDTGRTAKTLREVERRAKRPVTIEASPLFSHLEKELAAYFCGTLRAFTTPLDILGTPFQVEALMVLKSIPYGETISYKEQARRMGRPKAVRAVARANATNLIPIVLPCHRVVGHNGSLTGYGGGLDKKHYLLQLEQMGRDM